MAERQKRGRGRPPTKTIEPIPATFEEILQAVVTPADLAQMTDLSDIEEDEMKEGEPI